MIQHKDYIMKHYKEYGIMTSDKNWDFHKDEARPLTEAEFLGLLNILDAHGENLDTFHDATFNGTDFFCDIWFNYSVADDSEAYNALMQFNEFFTDEEFIDWMLQHIQDEIENYEDYDEAMEAIKRVAFDKENDEEIIKTEDGYVRIVRY